MLNSVGKITDDKKAIYKYCLYKLFGDTIYHITIYKYLNRVFISEYSRASTLLKGFIEPLSLREPSKLKVFVK